MKLRYSLLGRREALSVHEASLRVLAESGMRFESPALRQGLKAAGADIDETSGTARIPRRTVEETIENSKRLLASGRRLHLLNGVTSEKTGGKQIEAKISGGCEQYLDHGTAFFL